MWRQAFCAINKEAGRCRLDTRILKGGIMKDLSGVFVKLLIGAIVTALLLAGLIVYLGSRAAA